MERGKILVATPEITVGLKEGHGNLMRYGINFSNGGMAPVKGSYVPALRNLGDFDVHLVVPKWEGSLRHFNKMKTDELKQLEASMPGHVHMISDASFNKVGTQGTNTLMYETSDRFTVVDRAVAFSRGIANYVLPNIKPDILWVADWMPGPAAVIAKAMGIKVVTTGHNIITHSASRDYLISHGLEIRDFDNYHPEQTIWDSNGEFDFMASAINAADDFTTVSKSFLERIIDGTFDNDPEKSQAVISSIKNKANNPHADGRSRVHGYLNPLENEKSELLKSLDSVGLEETVALRKRNGYEVRKQVGLNEGGYLGIFPNRLYSFQKNPELLLNNAQSLAEKYDLRILILAFGDSTHENHAKQIAADSGGLIAYHGFDKSIEEKVKQSDNAFGIMTPHFEPCGGPNLNYPLEGTLIVGHAVDGIKDSVIEMNAANNSGTGFPFKHNDVTGLEYGISKFVEFANLPDNVRYGQLARVARSFLLNFTASARVKQLTEDIFLPLYHEKLGN